MTTMAQQTSVSVNQLRQKIAEALGVSSEYVEVRISSGQANGQWTEVHATIQIWDA